jgi:hypothetical protein
MDKKFIEEEFKWIHSTEGPMSFRLIEEVNCHSNPEVKLVFSGSRIDMCNIIDDCFKQMKNIGKWEQLKSLRNELNILREQEQAKHL